jgi:hypothetical protein
LTIFFLSGCGIFIKSEVTVFHELDTTPAPTKYSFFPLEKQINSLEYRAYQDMIRLKLTEHMFQEVSFTDSPDVIIVFDYSIDSGNEKQYTIPIYGETGISSSSTLGTIRASNNSASYSSTTTYKPSYGVVGHSTRTETKYSRSLWLHIVDAKKTKAGKLNILYEGKAVSSGKSSALNRVMPGMIDALFKKFPGKSGESRTEILSIQ